MKRPISELKRIARDHLTGQYTTPVIAALLVSLLPSLVLLPFSLILSDTSSILQNVIYYLSYFIVLILTVVLQAGQSLLHLNLARQKPYSLRDLIHCFRNRPDAYILAFLLYIVYLLPFFIPAAIVLLAGIRFFETPGLVASVCVYLFLLILAVMFALYYTQVFLLLLENPEQKLRAVFAKSRRLMSGNRRRFFLLSLSFIGLYLLGILSLGIGFLWINPYLTQSQIVFYQELTGELDQLPSGADSDFTQSSFAQP